MDRLNALRAFVLVGETASFSEAARRSHLSKSMVSRLVSSLESELGVRLMQRTTRRVTLTEAGRDYFERCRSILSELDDADLRVSQSQLAPRGRLRVSAPVSFATRHMAPSLPDFFFRHAEIEIDLVLNDRYVDLIEEGYDMAVRIGRLADSSLVARRLCPIRMAVCASPDYLALNGAPATPEALASHQCLAASSMANWRLIGENGRPITIPVGGRFRANNGDAVRAMVLAGCGIAFLPTFFVGDDIRAGTLVPLLQPFMPRDVALHAVYPHGRHLAPKVRAFVDFLAERFPARPPWDAGLFND